MINSTTGQRELAYLVTIDAVTPIEGYDRVALAHVSGWTIVVGKDDFKPGDPAVYFEIDSKLPEVEPFTDIEFLVKKHYKIKAQRMCKSISMGLLLPVAAFGWEIHEDGYVYNPKTGSCMFIDDETRFLTKELGVIYNEPDDNIRKAAPADKYKKMSQRHPDLFKKKPIHWLMKHEWGKKLLFVFFGKKKDSKTSFPTHFPYVHKSDEERIENCLYVFEDKTPWVKTTKIDGTSSTYILERKPFNRREYYVCSRNVRQLTPNQKTYHSDNVYWSVDFKYHIRDFLEDMLKKYPDWNYVALQGETAGIGEDGGKIQGDPHSFGELRFFGYNFIDSENGRWNSVDAKNLTEKYGIEWVPIVDEKYILPDVEDFENFKLSADGLCEAPGAQGMREGYVYRNVENPNKSFKNVSRAYLLKHNN